jgi:hypothetical protein
MCPTVDVSRRENANETNKLDKKEVNICMSRVKKSGVRPYTCKEVRMQTKRNEIKTEKIKKRTRTTSRAMYVVSGRRRVNR